MSQEPMFDIAQLAHVEIYTPNMEGSLNFFKDMLGLQESTRDGESVYLRGYEDFYHHTLKLTTAAEPGLGHMAWRTSSAQALERRVAALEESGYGLGWIDGDLGHGRAYQFTTPAGHKMEVLWEVEYAEVPEEKQSKLLNRPQRRPLQGIPVRRLDHVNLMAAEVTPTREFMQTYLGFRLREQILVANDTVEVGCWISVSPLVHEVAIMKDDTGAKGRLHHVCYWYGYPQHLSDLADVFRERDIPIEAGPGKHGISQAMFMYVYEPGGNRIELFGDCGYMIFDPTWKPAIWREDNLDVGIVWSGGSLPAEFFRYGTPHVEMPEGE